MEKFFVVGWWKEVCIGFGFVLDDFRKGLRFGKGFRKWGFVVDWVLLGSGGNFMIGCFIKFF